MTYSSCIACLTFPYMASISGLMDKGYSSTVTLWDVGMTRYGTSISHFLRCRREHVSSFKGLERIPGDKTVHGNGRTAR